MHWSIANKTALAEGAEYKDRIDISIYVNFPCKDKEKVYAAFDATGDKLPHVTIWTTTPWTLPANLAVSVHPRFNYLLVDLDGNIIIVAEELLDQVQQAAKAQNILFAAVGEKLAGLIYDHPFCDRTGKIVTADYKNFRRWVWISSYCSRSWGR